MLIIENIVSLFIVDTYICSINALQLMKYQMEKHGWTYEQWREYMVVYRYHLDKITIKK